MSSPSPSRPKLVRLRSIHRRMSFAAFERLPYRLGWKHEYYGGKAHVTPSWLTVTFLLDLVPRKASPGKGIRPLSRGDDSALQEVFQKAFALAPEYADYSAALFRKATRDYFAGFFGSTRGEWSCTSVVTETKGRLLGAALIKSRPTGPLLDCLFVDPDHARRGLATAMVGQVVAALLSQGESTLLSCARLANEPSIAWHNRFGFRELPDLWIATARARHCHLEWKRHDQLKDLPEDELAQWAKQSDFWWAEVERLEEMKKKDLWSVHPRFD